MIKNFIESEDGAAAIEALFIFPILVLLYFGLQDLTGLITLNRRLTASASSVADTVAQAQTSTTKAIVEDDFKAVEMIMAPLPISKVRVNLFTYRLSGSTVTTAWSMNNGSPLTCTAPNSAAYSSLMGGTPPNDVVAAVACMDYVPYVVTFFGENVIGRASFRLQQIITSRPRSTPKLDCFVSGTSGTACS